MTITPDSIRRNLSDLGGAASNVSRSNAEIHKAAADRRDVVNARLDELRPKALSDAAAGDEYMRLITERGQLDIVLGGGR